MDGTAYCIVLKRLHLKALIYDTLSSHSSVSMNYDWDDLFTIFLLATEEVLLSTRSTTNDWIDGLQV